MSISAADMKVIEDALNGAPGAAPVAELRRHLPHLSVTRCDASDVAEAPFRSFPEYELHLLNTADHCVTLTADPVLATGIVLARRGAAP